MMWTLKLFPTHLIARYNTFMTYRILLKQTQACLCCVIKIPNHQCKMLYMTLTYMYVAGCRDVPVLASWLITHTSHSITSTRVTVTTLRTTRTKFTSLTCCKHTIYSERRLKYDDKSMYYITIIKQMNTWFYFFFHSR